MKRIYLFLLLSFAVFAQTNLVRVPASTVGGSGAKCQLRGVAGTRTAAIDSINGVYNNPYFEFTVTTSGRYDLYYDSNGTTGGLSYSKQTDWSGTYGRWIDGMIDAERALTLQETADTDNDGKVETAGLEDSVITAIKILSNQIKTIHLQELSVRSSKVANDAITTSKILNGTILTADIADSQVSLQKMTTAAVNFIGSGGNVTNNPDDESIENKTGSTLGIKETYFVLSDTSYFASTNRDSAGMSVVLRQFSSSNTKGGGVFRWYSSGYTANGITVFAGSSGYWVRLVENPDKWQSDWAGIVADNSTDVTTKLQSFINSAYAANAHAELGAGVYVVSDTIFLPVRGFRLYGKGATGYSQDSTKTTTIRTTSTTDPIFFWDGNVTDGIVNRAGIMSMNLFGTAASTQPAIQCGRGGAYSGDYLMVEDVVIKNFGTGAELHGIAHAGFRNLSIGPNGTNPSGMTYGIRYIGSSFFNGNSFVDVNVGADTCYYINGSGAGGNRIVGGDHNYAKCNLYMTGGAQVSVESCNWESPQGNSAIIVEQGSKLSTNNTYFRSGGGAIGQRPYIRAGNSVVVNIGTYTTDFADTAFVTLTASSAQVYTQSIVEAYETTNGQKFKIAPPFYLSSTSVNSAAESLRGRIIDYIGNGSNQDRKVAFYRGRGGNYQRQDLLGYEHLSANDGSTPAYQQGVDIIANRQSFTFQSNASDTTIVKVNTGSAYSVCLYPAATVYANLAAHRDSTITAKLYALDPSGGRVIFVVKHPGISSGASNYLYYHLWLQRPD